MKKFLTTICTLAVCAILGVKSIYATEAETGSADMNGSRTTVTYKVDWSSKVHFWDVELIAKGKASTFWRGDRSACPTSITQNNIIQLTGIGSISLAADPSGEISGQTVTYTYSVEDYYCLTTTFDYHVRLFAIFDYQMDVDSTVQFGARFYDVNTY